ncbi:hypothetical protein TrVFT333_009562 [Trichoderma virens FT-333]|nr:hypothetical protein TrVFT333_009562 [Trichoderma virens FT-333]
MGAADADCILNLPLFRQTMFFTPFSTAHPALAIKIVDNAPLASPPPEKWLLGDNVKQLSRPRMGKEKTLLGVWTAVARNKWTPLTVGLLLDTAGGDNPMENIDLLDSTPK